ncbi:MULTISPECIES: hypothetical protein [Streptomyces]|uniref:hypothetical protein n=1 Tax=Streptomyces TaxID=1883 RepID=UPI0021DA930C|nr:hypothetical protein [Streptomyces sp. A13(2022)]MCU8592086.1 hypothetical protein [Streptomyces sp. A13(2022)]
MERRRSGHGRDTGGHDTEKAESVETAGTAGTAEPVETVLSELYSAPPGEFVPRREERAAAARTAGRKEDARRIHAARRPTLAAWAANLLTRSRPEEARRFLELGQALREAHRSLDAEGLKELSAQRRRIVAALSWQAAELASEAGHRLSPAAQREVESTLRAVLADSGAADEWAAGRLAVSLVPPSEFPADSALGAAPAAAEPRGPAPRPKSSRRASAAGDELAERRGRRREELARARQQAERAERRLRDGQAAKAEAEVSLRRAEQRRDRARETVNSAEERLRTAHEELGRVEREHREAAERGRGAAEEVTAAEQESRTASRRVDRLASRVG